MKNFTLICVAFVLAFTGCTLEKRHYRNGFYTNFHTRTFEKASGFATTTKDVEAAIVPDTAEVIAPVDLITDTLVSDTLVVNPFTHLQQEANERLVPSDTLANKKIEVSAKPDDAAEPVKNPIWVVLLGIFIAAAVIALVGWFVLDALLLVVFAAGIAFVEELITAGLVIVRATRKATNESEVAMKIKQRSMTLALIALGLLVGFIILVPMAELVGLIFAGLSILVMFAAGYYAYKAGKANQTSEPKESSQAKPKRPYRLGMISGYLSTVFAILGVVLLFSDAFVFVPILLFGLALVLGIYSIMRYAHYKKHRAEIVDPEGGGKDRGSWFGLALFFAILGLVLDLLVGMLSLLLFWALGGF